MILSIGDQKLRRKRNKVGFTPPFLKSFKLKPGRAGYTFIELMLTASIVLIIVGLSTPLLRNTFYALRVNLQAKDLSSLMNLARERAVFTRTEHLIRIDTANNTYRMFTADLQKNVQVPVEGRWGRSFKIAASLKVECSQEDIKFFPDGSSSGAIISFSDSAGKKSRLNVSAQTGEITVVAEKEK